jgi:transposase
LREASKRQPIMPASRRKFPREFKVNALRLLEQGGGVSEVAKGCDIDPNVLRRWRRDFQRSPEAAFPGPGRRPEQSHIAELRRLVERQAQEIHCLKQCVDSMQRAVSS